MVGISVENYQDAEFCMPKAFHKMAVTRQVGMIFY